VQVASTETGRRGVTAWRGPSAASTSTTAVKRAAKRYKDKYVVVVVEL